MKCQILFSRKNKKNISNFLSGILRKPEKQFVLSAGLHTFHSIVELLKS